jgi:hypothetical protein
MNEIYEENMICCRFYSTISYIVVINKHKCNSGCKVLMQN